MRAVALEKYLPMVGHSRWMLDDPEPLSLSLQVYRKKESFFKLKKLIDHLGTWVTAAFPIVCSSS